jgi:signal transduction histidine kinase
MGIGLLCIFTWITGMAQNWAASSSVIMVKTNMALCQTLAGAALILLSSPSPSTWRRSLAAGAATVVLALGSLTFAQHILHVDFGIDQLFAKEMPGARATAAPNRMGPPGSLSMAFVGIALLALIARRPGVAAWCGLLVCVINFVLAVGYVSNIAPFYSLPRLTGIAWPSVVALLAMGLGLVFAARDSGPLSLLLRNDPGGRLLRKTLPLVTLVPLVAESLMGVMHKISEPVAHGVMVIAVVSLLVAVLWRSALQLSLSSAAEAGALRDLRISEASLRESEQRLALATSGTRIGIFDWNLLTDEVAATEQTVLLLGLVASATATSSGSTALTHGYHRRDWAERVHPGDLARVLADIRHSVDERRPFEAEYRVIRPDGSLCWLWSRAVYEYSGDKAVRCLGILMDVTARRQAEAEIRESEERYRTLFESIDQGFCTIQVLLDDTGTPADYRFLSVNPSFERQTGIINAVGRRMREIAPHHEEHWFDIYGRIAATGTPLRFESPAAELQRHYDVFAWRIGDPSERKVAVLFQDITVRKNGELALRRLAEELRRSNKELEQFAYVTSHDLQEPLRMVTAFVDLLREQHGAKLEGTAATYLGYIVEGAERMQSLIKALLDYSRVRLETKGMQPVDLSVAVASAVEMLRLAIEESGARICCGKLPSVRADLPQMTQLFMNLIGNAIKFRREPPRIDIDAERQADCWVIRVRDNGIGIDAQDSRKVFEIFQRLHSRQEYAGTGIGLAICKKIVENHGGRIGLDSTSGAGSTFSFTLPYAGPTPTRVDSSVAADFAM